MKLPPTEIPIWLAPMGGGVSTPELAAAVAEAGGLGSLGNPYDPPDKIRAQVRAVRARTKKPLASNLFVPSKPAIDPQAVARSIEALKPLFARKGLPEPKLAEAQPIDFDAQLAVLIEERIDVFSFTFGIPGKDVFDRCHAAGIAVVGTATSVAEARALEAAGVDAVIAQGSEAGAHRGSFLGTPLVGTLALVPQVVDAVRIPVIAAGGIMDGRGLTAALALGATAAALGTAFMRTPEAGTTPGHRKALAASRDDSTVVTRVFTGRNARAIENAFIRALSPIEDQLPAFPIQHGISSPLRQAAQKAGDAEMFHVWAGQGAPLGRELPAAELVRAIAREAREVAARLRL